MFKKSLGQHFLANKNTLQKIVGAAKITPGDLIIEIGPGTGTLTDELLAAGAKIIAVEKDDVLAEKLKEKYKNKNIEIINDDILSYKLKVTSYKLVGNLPYYLTSHLLRVVLTTWPPFDLAVFMVQKEVAQRMTAKPPNMNMLAVLVRLYTKPELIAYIKRGNFNPVPKVDSAIVKLISSKLLLSSKSFSERDWREKAASLRQQAKTTDFAESNSLRLLKIAAQGFSHPRKKLSNNLPKNLLEKAGIDPSRRAETLTIEEWKSLAKI